MRHGYWGPCSDDGTIENALRTYKLNYTRLTDPASAAAELLCQGKILGWFQGRMEFGPRALGKPLDSGGSSRPGNERQGQ